MQLQKCPSCKVYTLKENCPRCKTITEDAHYKFKQLRDAPIDSSKHFSKQRKRH
jgi:rRNA maturation protein Nop10